ncbi:MULTISPECIES: YopX family protein [unclassified Helicobacter]|uniref:YopX family protein n=1 Tax=unclassified Helicobacter TaxID=2593540 RepID=UPI0015F1A711|nr:MULTISPECIES: YopX family protein [unclassified Helicobacter]
MKLNEFDLRVWDNKAQKYVRFYWDNSKGFVAENKIQCSNLELEIEQWTGYYDDNGVKIYVGDILRLISKNDDRYLMTTVLQNIFGTFHIPPNINVAHLCLNFECKVMGNIHENKDLLERKTDLQKTNEEVFQNESVDSKVI